MRINRIGLFWIGYLILLILVVVLLVRAIT
jgi:hypothetical protein